jgi:hypothetical protein
MRICVAGSFFNRNCAAANRGPMVWLLDGPGPVLYLLLEDFIVGKLFLLFHSVFIVLHLQ